MPASTEGEDPPRLPPLGPLLMVLGLVQMANTILATALPSVSGELGGARDYTAAVTVYMLPKALCTPVGGRLVDAYRPRRVVAVFCLLYLVGSLACGLAQSMDQLLFWRVVQGCGGGGLLASAYTFIDLLVPPRQQGLVQARVAIILGLGAAIAPLIGGLLTEHLGWRWCFFAMVPPMLVSLRAILQLPDLNPRGGGRVDVPGVVMLSGVAFPLLLALSWGGSRLPWNSVPVVGLFCLSLLAVAGFCWVEKRPREPLFDPTMLKDPVIGWSFVAAFCLGGAYLNTLIYGPLYMSVVKGFGPLMAGMSLLPFVIGNITGAVISGSVIANQARYRRLGLMGTALAAGLSLVTMVLLQQEDPPTLVLMILEAALAVAYGLCYEVYSVAVQNVTPMARQGMTGSALEFVRQLGSALGIAMVGSILLLSLDRGLPVLLDERLVPLGIKLRVTQFEDRKTIDDLRDEVLTALRKEADLCLGGDQAAYQRLLKSQAISPALKEDLRPDNDYPAHVQQRLEKAMQDVAETTRAEITTALATAVRRAQADVSALCCGLCLLALLASWMLPERPLRDQVL